MDRRLLSRHPQRAPILLRLPPITRDDRQFALDHLGLPVNFRPTARHHATHRANPRRRLRHSRQLQPAGGRRRAIHHRPGAGSRRQKLFLSAPLQDSAPLPRLFDAENAIAWKVAHQIDPQFRVAEQTFLAASTGVQLASFENYIRGTDAPSPAERIKRLQSAVAQSPTYAAAQLALGKELYTDRDYDQAAAVLAKVAPANRLSLEANFFLGLARFNAAKYAEAESAFAFVAARLPLPEVVNDQAVAQSRQGKDATPLFVRASQADPNDPDYHFNLAVAQLRKGDFPAAQKKSTPRSSSSPPTAKPPN